MCMEKWLKEYWLSVLFGGSCPQTPTDFVVVLFCAWAQNNGPIGCADFICPPPLGARSPYGSYSLITRFRLLHVVNAKLATFVRRALLIGQNGSVATARLFFHSVAHEKKARQRSVGARGQSPRNKELLFIDRVFCISF